MITAFVIYSLLAVLFLGIGILAWKSEKPVGFFASVTPPAVTDVKKYNRAVARLWAVGAVIFELLGIPLLFTQQDSPAAIFCILGILVWAIGMMIAYTRIEAKYTARF